MMYLKYRKNYFSQSGEDGIIEKIIEDLNLNQKLFICEFGAWDGKFLSNTFNLVKKKNAIALMIEGDDERYKDLIKTSKQYPNIIPINKFVTLEGDNSLEKILEKNNFPIDFDLLSIDIEGSEFLALKNFDFNKYNPKVIVVEYLDLSLPALEIKNLNINSAINSEIYKLIVSKNYTLVNMLHSDLVFVNNKFRD